MRQIPILTLTLFSLTQSAFAQKHTTAPDGYLSKSGGEYTYMFGRESYARQQFGDGTLPKRAMKLTGVAYRSQTRFRYDARYGMGRTWPSVTLTAGHTRVATMQKDFAKNYRGAGTQLFAGKLTFASLDKTPTPKQAWGNTVVIPFKTPFAYNGTDDLLLDYTFKGGVLANSGSFTRSVPYYMDGVLSTVGSVTVLPNYHPLPPWASGTHCRDSSITANIPAHTVIALRLYSHQYTGSSRLRGTAVLENSASLNTTLSAPTIAVLTFGGTDVGVDVGARCNKLYADMRFTLAMAAGRAVKLGKGNRAPGYSGTFFPKTPIPYNSPIDGLKVYMQAAWADSKSGAFSLTRACSLTLPRAPRLLPKTYVGQVQVPNNPSPIGITTAGWAQTLPRFGYQ